MKWSEEAWKTAVPIYQKILELDFIRELMEGTLRRDRFLHYIQQDAIYLVDYGKVLAGIASKLHRLEHREAFLSFANDCMAAERVLHQLYLGNEGTVSKAEPTPSCLLYTSYLVKQWHDAPVEVAAAAVLPCFWVYKGVGDYLAANQLRENNPYQAWIDMYGGEEFTASVNKAIGLCDEMAERCSASQRCAMTEAYVLCTKMEWMFWDSAWKMEMWPV